MEEPQRPLWVPPPPSRPRSRLERVWLALKRYGFAALCVVAAVGLGVLWLLLPDTQGREQLSSEELAELARNPQSVASSRAQPASAPDPKPTPEPNSGTGALSVLSFPRGATVMLDRDSLGATPLEGHEMGTGVYVLSIRKKGYAPVDTVLFLEEDQSPTLFFTLEERSALLADRPRLAEAEPPPDRTRSSRQAQRTEPSPLPSSPDAEQAAQEAHNQQEEAASASSRQETEAAPSRSQQEPEDPPPRTGTVRLTSEPSEAAVWLDGQPVGVTPTTVQEAAPGSHAVTFRKDGYQSRTANVTVAPGQTGSVYEQLPQLGTLRVRAVPWGSIYVDGTLRKQNTDVRYVTHLQPGRHQVRVEHPSLGRRQITVELASGEAKDVVINFNATSDDPESGS